MYDWRGRIGLIVPSSNTTMEMDYHRLAPCGVSICTARMRFTGAATLEDFAPLIEDTRSALQTLLDCRPNVVVWGCTAAIASPDVEKQIRQMIEGEYKIPCVMPLSAAAEALRTMKISRVSVAAPYTDEILEAVKRYLEKHGFTVINIKGLGLSDNHEIASQSPQVVYALARSVDSGEAEGIFISCTNLRALDLIQCLEDELGKPVVSSNQAGMWSALRAIRVKDSITGYGRLLSSNLH
ncbi:MAG: aspartate/glutamate racemase family protein [Nitrososphaerales archaeon]